MSMGETLFSILAVTGVSLYSAALLWLTLTYHDHQKLR
jgi:hypothetical protein